ncbi:hypothetical protein ROS217_23287 [Roseovarius sp. 217]|nr:hypothetical protein ROS217_23287 [Roseovarius sp. 217]
MCKAPPASERRRPAPSRRGPNPSCRALPVVERRVVRHLDGGQGDLGVWSCIGRTRAVGAQRLQLGDAARHLRGLRDDPHGLLLHRCAPELMQLARAEVEGNNGPHQRPERFGHEGEAGHPFGKPDRVGHGRPEEENAAKGHGRTRQAVETVHELPPKTRRTGELRRHLGKCRLLKRGLAHVRLLGIGPKDLGRLGDHIAASSKERPQKLDQPHDATLSLKSASVMR